jgi:deoxyribose-phosphate aldolase
MSITVKTLAKMIDHSLLHPTMTDADLKAGCEAAAKYGCATVCIKPYSVVECTEWLKGSDVAICAVAGFPHGNSHTDIIIAEAVRACREGATEIDIVTNSGKVLGGNWDYVTTQLQSVNDAVKSEGAILKVIFENDFLKDQHIIKLCEICSEVDVAFVKTSTGYGFVKQDNGMYSYDGATVADLKLMRKHTASHIQLKAAGAIRTLKDLLLVRSLGVTRIGASATAVMLDEAEQLLKQGIDLTSLVAKN